MKYKDIIKEKFSSAAGTYDKYDEIQRTCGNQLLTMFTSDSFTNILEIGCGTGNYTKLLAKTFPKAQITAIDFSKKMIQTARSKLKSNENISFKVDDGETFCLANNEKFDFITANATVQWFSDFERAMTNFQRSLTPNGVIGFSIFGPGSFLELDSVLEEIGETSIKMAEHKFHDFLYFKRVLNSAFKNNVQYREEIFVRKYARLYELLKTIKYTGENISSSSSQGINFTPAIIKKCENLFISKYGAVNASFKILFCMGRKKN